MVTYTFRLRFTLPLPTLSHDAPEVELPLPGHQVPAILKARGAPSIKEATSFTITAQEFPSETAAREAGERVRTTLQLTCVDLRSGLDTTDRPSTVGFGKLVLEKAKEIGIDLRGDPHGLVVYPDNPRTKFMSVQATAVVSSPIDRFKERFSKYLTIGPPITDEQALGLELYSLSHFEASARARFVTLISALESTVTPTDRGAVAQAHLNSLIQVTQAAKLDEADKKTLVNALGNLKTESITTACRRLVQTYGQEGDELLWQECHSTRHKLVHSGKASKSIHELLPKLDSLVRSVLIESVLRNPRAAA